MWIEESDGEGFQNAVALFAGDEVDAAPFKGLEEEIDVLIAPAFFGVVLEELAAGFCRSQAAQDAEGGLVEIAEFAAIVGALGVGAEGFEVGEEAA